jgi:diguanylate cyclase (GGDEF)-like protein
MVLLFERGCPRRTPRIRTVVWPDRHNRIAGRCGATVDDAAVGRKELAPRVRPFLLTGVLVGAIGLYPYESATPHLTLSGVAAGSLICAGILLVPWQRWPYVALLPQMAFCGVVALLMAGDGSVNIALAAALAVPILWSSLYGRAVETALVTAAAAAAVLVVWRFFGHVESQDIVQPVAAWTAVALLIAYAAHVLRLDLAAVIQSREEMIRRTAVSDLAATEMYSSLDPDEVVRIGLRAAAHLVVPDEEATKEAFFLLLENESATLLAHYDQNPDRRSRESTFAAADVPLLSRVGAQAAPLLFTPDDNAADPREERLPGRLNLMHGVAISVRMSELSEAGGPAVLIVASHDNRRFTAAQAGRLSSFATVYELALSRALKHAADATTDQVTGLANRREFQRRLHTMPRGDAFSLLSIEVEGYDYLVETEGRYAGEELLRGVTGVLRRSLRSADVIARMAGGDFSVILAHASETQARTIAERLIAGTHEVRVHDRRARMTVGAAFVPGGADPDARLAAADAALYRAKTAGGGRVVIDEGAPAAEPSPPAPALNAVG